MVFVVIVWTAAHGIILNMDTFISERSTWLIGVVCAKGMGRTLPHFSSLSYSKGPLVLFFIFLLYVVSLWSWLIQ